MKLNYSRPDYAAEVKSAVSMEDAIRAYHKLGRRRGRTSCPIHGGTHDNLSYNAGSFHCFVCGASGDVISFVMQLYGLSFINAVKKLADDFHLQIDMNEHMMPSPETIRRTELNKAVRNVKEAERQCDMFAMTKLCQYYRWLNSLSERTPIIVEQLESIDRMTDRAIRGELHIKYDIDTMLDSMRAVVLESIGQAEIHRNNQ
ncbi:MAG: hypothetical protein HFE63_03825 [Clostridiales bacterium]|nr:hypothetical protein [Clostridiales bacterium]